MKTVKPGYSFFNSNKQHILTSLIITLIMVFLMIIEPGFLKAWESKLLDMRFKIRGESTTSGKIAIINIDDKSIAKIGAWPWSRDIHASIIDRLNIAGTKVIAFDIYFQQSHKNHIKEEDQILVNAVNKVDNVIFPVFFNLNKNSVSGGTFDKNLDQKMLSNAAIENPDSITEFPVVKGYTLFSSFPELNQAAKGLGHINMLADPDGILRKEVLLIKHQNSYVPSLALKTAQVYLDKSETEVTVILGERIQLGNKNISIDPVELNGFMLWGLSHINYRGGYGSFDYFSYVDVLNDRFPMDAFKNKIVLIGATAAGLYDLRSTPFSPVFPGVEKHANVIDNILLQDFIRKPFQSDVFSAIICIAIGLGLTFALPRLWLRHALLLVSILTFLVVSGSYLAFSLANLWINIIFPLLTTWLIYLTSVLLQLSSAKSAAYESSEESYEAMKLLGLSYQEKGSLEMAFHTFMKLPLNEEIMILLYNLAMQLEKVRKESLATQIYKKLYQKDNLFEDVASRLNKPDQSTPGQSKLDTIQSDHPQGIRGQTEVTEKPTHVTLKKGQTLGRYEILKQLGKGAMGEVYLAKDDTINRDVAIKTFQFNEKFKDKDIEKIKKDLLKEAQMAGKLSHPNIVTIFDAGEDWDLSYVAMEVLEGVELTEFCQPDKLLSYDSIVEIIATVASALDYAHQNGIIHRDIKPANIMIQKEKGIKITDFGIACINEQNMENNEIAGTPFYMSPEQISGSPLDGRSDLYSLGIVLFEMLTGTRPFTAKRMNELVNKILYDPVPSLKTINTVIPNKFQSIVNKLLAKNKNERYDSGKALADDLADL